MLINGRMADGGRGHGAAGAGGAALVGGATAFFADQKTAIAAHVPLALAILLLWWSDRSDAPPVKGPEVEFPTHLRPDEKQRAVEVTVAMLPLMAWFVPRLRDQIKVLAWIRKGGYVSHESQKQKDLFGDLPTIEDSVARYCRDKDLIKPTTS